MFYLNKTLSFGKELHTCVVEELAELMEVNKKVIVLENNLASLKKRMHLSELNLNPIIDRQMSEKNLIGIAAGLSLTGYTPFIYMLIPSAIRNMFDQLFISEGYVGQTLNIIGVDSQPNLKLEDQPEIFGEDIALMAMVPHSIICEAADVVQMEWILKEFSQHGGIHYVRNDYNSELNVYSKKSVFQLGRGIILCEGSDILIIAAGQSVSEALRVAHQLKTYKISCEVIDMFTIKPIDKQLIIHEVKRKKQVIILEKHAIIGGLGSSIAMVFSDAKIHIPMKIIEVTNCSSLKGENLQTNVFDLTTQSLVATIVDNYMK